MGNLVSCSSSVEDELKVSVHKLLEKSMISLKKDLLECIRIEISKSATVSKSISEPPIKD